MARVALSGVFFYSVLLCGQESLLLDVPNPDLSGMDAPVQQQIHDAQAHVAGLAKAAPAEQARAYGKLGQIYTAYALQEAAIPCFKNAAALDPTEFKWPYYLAYIFQTKGDLQQATENYSTALTLRPDDEIATLRLADTNLKLDHLDVAEQLYEKARAKNQQSVPALDGRGRVALARRQYQKAAELLNQALTINPEAAYLHYPLAMAYRGLGEVEKAQAELAKHGPAAPELVDRYLTEIQDIKTGRSVLWAQASQQMAAEKFSEAIASYRQMIQINDNDLVARTYLGTALARAGATDEAIRELSEVLRRAPADTEANYCLGVVYARSGKDAEAIQHFQATIKGDPQFAEVHFQLANVLMRVRQYENAVAEYSKTLERTPDNAFASLMKALALVRLQRYHDARAALEQAHTTTPANLDVVNILARLLAAAPDDSVRDGRRSLELMQPISKNGTLDLDQAETIAMALAETGNFDKAAALQRTVIENLENEDPARVAILRETLALYEKQQPCRRPWRDDDPIFVPTPGTNEILPNADLNTGNPPHPATQIDQLIPATERHSHA